MTCSIDLKAYSLDEMSRVGKAAAEEHLGACETCREELERLECTRAALLSIEEEEIPRRIAFVSDGVFEPRWWQRMWRSGPAMGFASAALLAGAILAHGFTRPAVATQSPSIDSARLEQSVRREVGQRLDAAVASAVAASEARQSRELAQRLDAVARKYELQRKADLVAMQETARYYDKQYGRLLVSSNQERGGQ